MMFASFKPSIILWWKSLFSNGWCPHKQIGDDASWIFLKDLLLHWSQIKTELALNFDEEIRWEEMGTMCRHLLDNTMYFCHVFCVWFFIMMFYYLQWYALSLLWTALGREAPQTKQLCKGEKKIFSIRKCHLLSLNFSCHQELSRTWRNYPKS